MRVGGIAITLALLAAVPAGGQTLTPEPHPYGLDPYKPSDAALLRAYGSTLVAQTPLLELNQLDPYKPSHAALLRQLGGGMPLWSHLSWYPTAPPPAPLMLQAAPTAAAAAGAPKQGGVVIIVPPNDRFVAPRQSPEGPRRIAPPVVPIQPAPNGPRKASAEEPATSTSAAAQP
jgi:hypothetical protein